MGYHGILQPKVIDWQARDELVQVCVCVCVRACVCVCVCGMCVCVCVCGTSTKERSAGNCSGTLLYTRLD
jgi:hypothetical protein